MEEYIFANVVHLCHNKHHILSLEVQDLIWYMCNDCQFWKQQLGTTTWTMIDLFKAPNTFRATFVKIVTPLLVQFPFIDEILVYIKDEGSKWR